MRTRPTDLLDEELIRAVRDHWGLEAGRPTYVAVGGGSQHWRAANLWLTVDDLDQKPFLGQTRSATLDGVRAALELAATLQQAGLEFVVAPRPTREGAIVVPLAEHYALAVYPFLSGTSYPFGTPLPAAEREELLELLIRLHQSMPAQPAQAVGVEIALRAAIIDAIDHVGQEWRSGPYADQARQAVAAHTADLEYLLASFDRLAESVTARRAPPVVSHGEPHPANLMRLDTHLLLLDWDTVGLATPERDLWWLVDMPGLAARYASATGRAIDADAMRLYRLRWQLDDVAYALSLLRAAHADSIETRLSSATLARSVEVPEWMR